MEICQCWTSAEHSHCRKLVQNYSIVDMDLYSGTQMCPRCSKAVYAAEQVCLRSFGLPQTLSSPLHQVLGPGRKVCRPNLLVFQVY